VIYVNGDSWSQKSRTLVDYSWPKILQDTLCYPVENQSAGCGSNSRMLSNLYKTYQSGKRPDLIIIALTSFQRWHFPSRCGSSWSIGPTVINDRYNNNDETILNWWRRNVFDEVEFVYQYYNQIWQMHELSTKYFQCPIIFFNAWDVHISQIHQQIFYNNIQKWLESKLLDMDDYATIDYIKSFDFFKNEITRWNHLIDQPWTNFLTNYIDDSNGLHPNHPSPDGHRLICDHVISTIKEKFPTTYQKFKGLL
jgi:hypothetical protein